MDYAIGRAIESNIQKVRSDVAFETLARGDYELALKQFSEYIPRDAQSGRISKYDWWTSDRHQGMALAYMGIGDWNKALVAIDAALDQRKNDFKSAICKCHGLVEMYLTKATILDKLDRGSEAKLARLEADAENLPHSKLPPGLARTGVPIGVYYDWLKRVRLGLEEGNQGSDK
jgi:tetratricopeptide (TPR) repeat protein